MGNFFMLDKIQSYLKLLANRALCIFKAWKYSLIASIAILKTYLISTQKYEVSIAKFSEAFFCSQFIYFQEYLFQQFHLKNAIYPGPKMMKIFFLVFIFDLIMLRFINLSIYFSILQNIVPSYFNVFFIYKFRQFQDIYKIFSLLFKVELDVLLIYINYQLFKACSQNLVMQSFIKYIIFMIEDLLSKLEKDENFRTENEKNIQRYKTLQQAAQYSNLQLIPPNMLRKVEGKDIYLYFGYLQPHLKKDLRQVAIYLVKNFRPNPKKPYTFVFFNDKCQDNYVLWNFREIFSYVKIQQISALSQFIVVKPYFYHKTMDWMTFGTIPKFIKSRTKFIYSYKQLCQYLKFPETFLVQNVPNILFKEELPEVFALTISLSIFRMNIQGQSRSQQQTNQLMQFHKSIKSMVIKPGYQINNLQDYDISAQGVPTILKMLVFYFDSHKEGLLEEGLMRKSVSIDEENQTINQILQKNFDYLLQVKNSHIIANLIKRFFSTLKTPVFPFDKFNILMNDQGVQDKTQHLKKVFQSLPQLNKRTLTFVFTFFKDKIISNQHYNKMSVQNVAICFAPCIFRSEKPSVADLIYASKAVLYCKLLLTDYQKIFGSQEQRQQLYRSSYIQTKQTFEQELDMQISNILQTDNQIKMERNTCNQRVSHNFDQGNNDLADYAEQEGQANNYFSFEDKKQESNHKQQNKEQVSQNISQNTQKNQLQKKQDNIQQNEPNQKNYQMAFQRNSGNFVTNFSSDEKAMEWIQWQDQKQQNKQAVNQENKLQTQKEKKNQDKMSQIYQ